MHERHSQISKSVPAIEPITIPAMAPPEREPEQLQLVSEFDWRGERWCEVDEDEDEATREEISEGSETGCGRGIGAWMFSC
jgi:hypothetical protein